MNQEQFDVRPGKRGMPHVDGAEPTIETFETLANFLLPDRAVSIMRRADIEVEVFSAPAPGQMYEQSKPRSGIRRLGIIVAVGGHENRAIGPVIVMWSPWCSA